MASSSPATTQTPWLSWPRSRDTRPAPGSRNRPWCRGSPEKGDARPLPRRPPGARSGFSLPLILPHHHPAQDFSGGLLVVFPRPAEEFVHVVPDEGTPLHPPLLGVDGLHVPKIIERRLRREVPDLHREDTAAVVHLVDPRLQDFPAVKDEPRLRLRGDESEDLPVNLDCIVPVRELRQPFDVQFRPLLNHYVFPPLRTNTLQQIFPSFKSSVSGISTLNESRFAASPR